MHVCEARKARNKIEKQYQMSRKVSSSLHNLDYDKCLSLLPDIETDLGTLTETPSSLDKSA